MIDMNLLVLVVGALMTVLGLVLSWRLGRIVTLHILHPANRSPNRDQASCTALPRINVETTRWVVS